jgi:hypothetical protein
LPADTLYGGIDDTSFGGGGGSVTDFPPIPGLAPTSEAMLDADVPAYSGPPGSAHAPPRFYKLDFPTFDGAVNPLNWLHQCEQFFRSQRTLASDHTWLASYHLRGASQTRYYTLEHDEGMPTWERFHVVCQLQFGPPTQGTRLAELARLPFTSTVQEYAERCNTVLCHTDDDLGPRQKAKLFVGGLPEHIRVDVKMQHPPDLQTAMYYARAFERRAVVYQARTEAVTALHPSNPDTGPGRTDGGHPWRVGPDSCGRAVLIQALIPSRAAGAPTQGPLLQL